MEAGRETNAGEMNCATKVPNSKVTLVLTRELEDTGWHDRQPENATLTCRNRCSLGGGG